MWDLWSLNFTSLWFILWLFPPLFGYLHYIWPLTPSPFSGFPFPLFFSLSSFFKICSVCQSRFKFVSCFNLITVISFSLSRSTSFPLLLLPTPCWFAAIILSAHVMWPTMSLYILSHQPSLSLSLSLDSVSLPLISLCLLSIASTSRERGLFLFSHLRRSIKEAPPSGVRIEKWCYL